MDSTDLGMAAPLHTPSSVASPLLNSSINILAMPPTLLTLPPELLLQILSHIPFHLHPSPSSHLPILLTHRHLTTLITAHTSTLIHLITTAQFPLTALALGLSLSFSTQVISVAQLAWVHEIADTIDETPNLALLSQTGNLVAEEGRVETVLARGAMQIRVTHLVGKGVEVEFVERGEVLGKAHCRSMPCDR